ncbi:MAG: DUF6273 domain-containing protein [Oscillospiraceae bacterium]|jgi:hypothetical protein|nr:DUF6273 domain-containing protein [Oscillospiraceae bacterium]
MQALNNLPVGARLKLREDGVQKQFFVADKSGIYGVTAITMMRRDIARTDGMNIYGQCACYHETRIDYYLKDHYPQLLDADIRAALITVQPNTWGRITSGDSYYYQMALDKKVYIPSAYELDGTTSVANRTDGPRLQIFAGPALDHLWEPVLESTGETIDWWTRTVYGSGTGSNGWQFFRKRKENDSSGNYVINSADSSARLPENFRGIRPMFNLPYNLQVSDTVDSDGCYTYTSTAPTPGAIGLYVKQSGSWTQASGMYAKQSGSWNQA